VERIRDPHTKQPSRRETLFHVIETQGLKRTFRRVPRWPLRCPGRHPALRQFARPAPVPIERLRSWAERDEGPTEQSSAPESDSFFRASPPSYRSRPCRVLMPSGPSGPPPIFIRPQCRGRGSEPPCIESALEKGGSVARSPLGLVPQLRSRLSRPPVGDSGHRRINRRKLGRRHRRPSIPIQPLMPRPADRVRPWSNVGDAPAPPRPPITASTRPRPGSTCGWTSRPPARCPRTAEQGIDAGAPL